MYGIFHKKINRFLSLETYNISIPDGNYYAGFRDSHACELVTYNKTIYCTSDKSLAEYTILNFTSESQIESNSEYPFHKFDINDLEVKKLF